MYTEAASYTVPGSEDALGTLLRADAMRSLLLAINKLTPIDPPLLKAAFARALRTLTSSLSEVVGPSQWGLAADSSTVRDEAKAALDYLFEVSDTSSCDININLTCTSRNLSMSTSHSSSTRPTIRAHQSPFSSALLFEHKSIVIQSQNGLPTRNVSRKSRQNVDGRKLPPSRAFPADMEDG